VKPGGSIGRKSLQYVKYRYDLQLKGYLMKVNPYDQLFGNNLANQRRQKNWTQRELGDRIGIGHSSISLWEKGERSPSVTQLYLLCKVLGCSPSDMLASRSQSNHQKGIGLEWDTNLPDSHSLRYTENILDGIQLFQWVVSEGFDYSRIRQMEAFSNLSPEQLRNKINAALLAKGIEIINVDRDRHRENLLKEKYHLMHCYVAKLDGLVKDGLADIAIRSEAVAFLAARFCIPLLRGFEHVGLTGGIPIARFFDLIPPLNNDIAGITWHAILSTERHLSAGPLDESANGIISRLLYSQPHTRGFTMPFINQDRRSLDYYRASQGDEKAELDYANSTRRTATYSQAVFLSVGSPEYDYASPGTERVNPDLVKVYNRLTEEDRSRCKGDLMLRLLDENGQRAGLLVDQQLNDAFVYSIELDRLKQMVKSKKQVWILSEVQQKAAILRAVLSAEFANCLVIEDRVADELLT
jgi:transcriptional regulator with XRE-family HTH domain